MVNSISIEKVLYYYKLLIIIVFLSATTIYTDIIYEYGVYLIVFFSLIITPILIKSRRFCCWRKLDWLILGFVCSYIITTAINYDSGLARQFFVLGSCIMYFLCFLSADVLTLQDIRTEIKNIFHMIVLFSIITTSVSYVKLLIDIRNSTTSSFNLHDGEYFQLYGIYSGISTMAIVSGLSAICSLFLFFYNNERNQSLFYKLFLVVNFFLQVVSLILTYTSAGIIAVGSTLFLMITFILYHRNNYNGFVYSLVCIIISIVIVASIYYTANSIATYLVDNYIRGYEVEITADDSNAIKGMSNSNGRREIWEESLKQWKENLFFGIGYGNFQCEIPTVGDHTLKYDNIHNGYLELLVACGLVGFLCIMILGVSYLIRFIVLFIKYKDYQNELGVLMIIVYAGEYAMVNQLFILDRSILVAVLFIAMGTIRKMSIVESVDRK